MKNICDRDCSNCPFANAGTAIQSRKAIAVAVTGTRTVSGDRTVVFGDYCLRFTPLPEVSSILDFHPDIVLNLVDSTCLESSMYPVTKLIDMELKAVIALENYADLLSTEHSVDYRKLGDLLGYPVIPADYDSEKGIETIASSIVDAFRRDFVKKVNVPYGNDLEEEISTIIGTIRKSESSTGYFSNRYIALRLLEGEDYILPYIQGFINRDEILRQAERSRKSLEREFGTSSVELVREARRGFVNGALQETVRHSKDNSDHTTAQKIDAVLTNKWLGLPVLLVVLLVVFEATFALGAWPQKWIGTLIGSLCIHLKGILSEGWFTSMLVDGVIQGVGAVLAFLPNIIILFFFLSMLEDIGYMARAAYIMDKFMHKVGLHGKSFIPMLIGFGCNVPAIMAARSIDNRKDRTLTMLMIPYMSCSARLPVYMLFVSAFFARYKALVMISIYMVGIILSILFAFIMKRTEYFRKTDEDFVSELPAFRKPTLRNTGLHIWERISDYLKKISTVILAASVIIWALEYFPSERTQRGTYKENSCLAEIGRWMSPVMEPLGFDWKMNVCILTGLPAKEAIVSTMGILYHSEDDDVINAMNNARYTTGEKAGEPVFTPAVSISFMLFVLLYFPCIATIATLNREVGRKWAAFSVIHSILLAWLVAFLAFRLFSLML